MILNTKKWEGSMRSILSWLIDNTTFLLHWINNSTTFLLHWISNNPTVAPIIVTIVTGMMTLFVQQWSLKKQLKIFQRQTTASEIQTAILLEDKKARDLGPYLQLNAQFMPQEYQGTSENTVRLCVGNLTKKDVMIRSIRISKNSPFKFVKNACHFVDWKIQGSNEHLIFNKTSSKHISLCPEKIKSNADKEYALNFFIVPAARSTCFDLIITCRSFLTCRKPSSRNIANFTLEHTSIVNPEETFTVHFWASWPRSKDTHIDIVF